MIKEEEEPSILSGQPSSVDSLFVRRGTKHWSERCDGAQKEVDPFASSERGAARAGARQTPLVGLIDVQSLLSVPTPRSLSRGGVAPTTPVIVPCASSMAALSGPAAHTPPTTTAAGTVTVTSGSGGAGASATVTVAGTASSQFQRLKVEDALSYLDQVKLQFGNHPQVYNDFLDIMKEFKSQSIDTPGVISRVSHLFKGHPDLIVGFNTFLPPGFKIEVHHNEINISGPPQHSNQLQRIAAQHNSSTAAAAAVSALAQAASSQMPSQVGSSTPSQSRSSSSSTPSANPTAVQTPGSAHQPVEFNHAINYVNKIKNRFQQHPDIYKAFLEILHTYQKEQRLIKEGGTPSTSPLSESEVYSQVSKLFQNQEDLLSEFGQFLPDATAAFNFGVTALGVPPTKKPALTSAAKGTKPTHSRKGSQSSNNSSGPGKKPKSSAKDVLAQAGLHTNYAELALFDKIRKALRSQDVYENFLRCLVLFNEEIISRQELVQLVVPFIGKFPELLSSFKTLLGFREPALMDCLVGAAGAVFPAKERVAAEFAAEIDFHSLKRHGASYRALPRTYVQPKCSGRTSLCRDVLNDTWVSFPMWSEDSTFQGTRKTQYEEYIFRCEDERFELDVVLETNLSTIRVFEALQKKLSRMSPDEAARFTLGNTLSGNSEVLQRKAIHRIYGDKAADIIEGLKKSPSVAVPIVLKRLKAKQEEWLEAQRAFNKTWRDQLEKYYLKSLDHQGITYKAVDTRAIRSKSLIAEIETLFDERQEQMVEGAAMVGPHLVFTFPEVHSVFGDCINLVVYYMKRASSLQREEAIKIRSFLTHTLTGFCFYPRMEVNAEDDLSPESDSEEMEVDFREDMKQPKATCSVLLPDTLPQFMDMDYHIFFTNNSLYTFFRLFQLLCERLNKLYQQSLLTIQESTQARLAERDTVAVQLGLRKPPDIQVDEYYPTFLNMAKNFMEGNIDSTTYEDTCREMFGVHAYVGFTIDRLVQSIVRQLHTIVADENCFLIMEVYTNFVEGLSSQHLRAESRARLELACQKKVESLLSDQNCYKITCFQQDRKLTIELLDTEEPVEESTCNEMKKYQSYVQHYSKPEEEPAPELREILSKRTIFLRRSHRWHSNPPTLSPLGGEEEKEKWLSIHLPRMKSYGTIEFKMDKKSYRMIPLANCEDCLYNWQALKRTRQVNQLVGERKQEKLRRWYAQKLQTLVTTEDQKSCSLWLKGRAPGYTGPPTQVIQEVVCGHQRNRYITSGSSQP